MSIKSKLLAGAAALTLVGGVGMAGALAAGPAAAGTPSCGPGRVKSELLAAAAMLTLVSEVGAAGALTATAVFQAAVADRRVGLRAASPDRRAGFSSIRAAARRVSMAPTGRARQLGWAG
jgi:hypothetical protein